MTREVTPEKNHADQPDTGLREFLYFTLGMPVPAADDHDHAGVTTDADPMTPQAHVDPAATLATADQRNHNDNLPGVLETERLDTLVTWWGFKSADGDPAAIQCLAAVQLNRAVGACMCGSEDLAFALAAKAVANLDRAADLGSELAADSLTFFADCISAPIFAEARRLRLEMEA